MQIYRRLPHTIYFFVKTIKTNRLSFATLPIKMPNAITIQEKAEIARYGLLISMDRWAPACWRSLNYIAFGNEVVASSAKFSRLMSALTPLIPCPMCREHLQQYLIDHPLKETHDAGEWLVELHNSVSKRTGAPSMSYTDVKTETHLTLTAHEVQASNDIWAFLFVVATLYVPEKQKTFLRIFLEEVAFMFPVGAVTKAMGGSTLLLDSPKALFGYVLSARNSWAASCGEEEDSLFDAVERSAMPQLYETLGITDPSDAARLRVLFDARTHNHRLARDRAYERIKALNVDVIAKVHSKVDIIADYLDDTTKKENDLLLNHSPNLNSSLQKCSTCDPQVVGDSTRFSGLSTSQIAGIAVGGTVALFLLALLIWYIVSDRQKIKKVVVKA